MSHDLSEKDKRDLEMLDTSLLQVPLANELGLCDACGIGRAKVRAEFAAGELEFCRHCYTEQAVEINEAAIVVVAAEEVHKP